MVLPTAHPGPLDMIPLNFYPLPQSRTTPLNVDLFKLLLADHPDQVFVEYVLKGLEQGFRLGYASQTVPFGRVKNLLSARQHSTQVAKAILKELNRGHTVGPFNEPPLSPFHCSPLGAVPKKDGTVRLILDLSCPNGASINEGIPKEEFSVKYSKFDDAVDLIRSLGKGAFMAKIDIKHAFRICPVHPDDWGLLGYSHDGKFYIDIRLPFGGRSSPFIFNTVADAIHWILTNKFNIAFVLHYLDDFFKADKSFESCSVGVASILQIFQQLGVPIALDKLAGPCTVLTYLGIEIDTVNMVTQLSQEKLVDIVSKLKTWSTKSQTSKRELLSLIGSLSFACKVIKPGRMFLRRLIDLSITAPYLHSKITITTESNKDILWWLTFIETWNGRSKIQEPIIDSSSLQLFSDASNLGIGGFFHGRWFSVPWSGEQLCITYRELVAVKACIATWGQLLRHKQIWMNTDNEAIIYIWSKGSSKDPTIMSVVRSLFSLLVEFNINIMFRHLPGNNNTYADLLSRLQVAEFLQVCPWANDMGDQVPTSIWQDCGL